MSRIRNLNVNTLTLLLAFFALALGLRLWGIDFGLPYEYHPDEWLYVRQAARMGDSGLEPTMWNNPPFFKYLLFGEYGVLYVIGKLMNWFTSPADFGSKLLLDPTPLFLIGRVTSAVIGALTIFLAYWLGAAVSGRRVGVLAALFLSIAFMHVRSSHFAVNDTLVTFLVTLALIASVMIIKTGHKKWYIIGAAALGIGFSTKYSGLVAILPLFAAHFMAPSEVNREAKWRKFALIPAISIVGAFLASPYFVIAPGRVIADVYTWLLLPGREGFDGWLIDAQGGYLFFLKTLIWELNWILVTLILAGFAIGVFSRSKAIWVILALILPHYIFIGAQKMFFARFLLLALPALLVLAAYALHQIVNRFLAAPRINQAAFISIGLLACAWPLAASIQYDMLVSRIDTRTLSKEWIEANIPEGAVIGLEWPYHTPQLAGYDQSSPYSLRQYQVHHIGGCGASEYNLDEYRKMGIQYLVISSYIYDIPLSDKVQDQSRNLYYANLNTLMKPIAQFNPFKNGQEGAFIFEEIYGPVISIWNRVLPGPIITIYQIE